MAEEDAYINEFINRMYGIEKEQPIDRLILSLDSLSIILNMPTKSTRVLQEVKKKMHEHRGVKVSKRVMKRLIEVIVESAKTDKVNIFDIENTFKDMPQYDLETSNTIILPDTREETQYEFKSILEDVEERVNNLAEKTQGSLDINIGLADKYIQQKKSDKIRRLDEIKESRNILPSRDTLYNSWGMHRTNKSLKTNEKCNEIISRINEIIEKSEGGTRDHTFNRHITDRNMNTCDRNSIANEQVKKLETYETHFNEKMLSLLTDLSDKIAKPSSIPLGDLKDRIDNHISNLSDRVPERDSIEPVSWTHLVKYTGAGIASGIVLGIAIMYSACTTSMLY